MPVDDEGPRPDSEPTPPDLVPGASRQPSNRALDDEFVTEPLEDDDGRTRRIEQSNVGPDNELGSGEFPDPDTPPTGPSIGVDDVDADPSLRRKEQEEVVAPDDRPAPGGA